MQENQAQNVKIHSRATKYLTMRTDCMKNQSSEQGAGHLRGVFQQPVRAQIIK